MPPHSQAQREAMHAAAEGHSTLGIPKKVGEEYDEADEGGKLPKKVSKEAGVVKRIMRAFKMNEISAVDRPAQAHAKVVLMKRDDGITKVSHPSGYAMELDRDGNITFKRDFSAAQRRSAASSGDALPDGSFPIKNKEDLANARRLVGHAKDKAAAEAHIRRRAKELGVSLDNDKDAKKGLMNIFRGWLEGAPPEEVHKTLKSFDLETDMPEITMTDDIKKMIDDKVEEVRKDLGEKLVKAEEELATLKGESGKDGGHDDDDDGDGAKGGEIKGKAKKANSGPDDDGDFDEDGKKGKMKKADLPEDIKKALAKAEANEIILKGLMEEREIAQFAKQAVELGLEEVHGETLRKAFSGDKTGQADLKKLMKGMAEQIRTGKVFAEFGSAGSGNGIGTATDELKLAAETYRKSQIAAGKKCTPEQAFTAVYIDPAHADLKKRYDTEDMKKRLRVA